MISLEEDFWSEEWGYHPTKCLTYKSGDVVLLDPDVVDALTFTALPIYVVAVIDEKVTVNSNAWEHTITNYYYVRTMEGKSDKSRSILIPQSIIIGAVGWTDGKHSYVYEKQPR